MDWTNSLDSWKTFFKTLPLFFSFLISLTGRLNLDYILSVFFNLFFSLFLLPFSGSSCRLPMFIGCIQLYFSRNNSTLTQQNAGAVGNMQLIIGSLLVHPKAWLTPFHPKPVYANWEFTLANILELAAV